MTTKEIQSILYNIFDVQLTYEKAADGFYNTNASIAVYFYKTYFITWYNKNLHDFIMKKLGNSKYGYINDIGRNNESVYFYLWSSLDNIDI